MSQKKTNYLNADVELEESTPAVKKKAEQDIEYGKARFRSYRNDVSQPVHDSDYNLLYSSGNAYCIYNAVCRQCF